MTPKPKLKTTLIATLLRFGAAMMVGGALFYGAQGMAEMIRAGEERFEDLHPEGEPIGAAPPSAPVAQMRAQALLAARLEGLPRTPAPYSIDALAAQQGEDEVLTDLVYWRKARRGAITDWAEARDFLIRRPHWPRTRPLRMAVERKMPETLSGEERLAFFAAARPLSARGARLYGEALIASGRPEQGAAEIVRGWSRLPGPLEEEKLYQKRHGALLDAHHVSRFETLLWRKRLNAARRLTKNLPEGWDRLADAVTALHRSGGGVDRKIARVPKALSAHPALSYARMVWRERRRRRLDAEETMREADAGGALGDAVAWADERMRFARDAYEDGRAGDAAALAAGHQLNRGVDFAALEWFAGWMRLVELGRPREALEHFSKLWGGVKTPISRARAAFWASQAADAAGDKGAAKRWRARAAALPSAFYGQLAAEKMRARPDLSDAPGTRRAFDPDQFDAVERGLMEAADRLYLAEWRDAARYFMTALAERRSDAASLGWLARRARGERDLRTEIEIAKRAFAVGAPLWSSLFPIPSAPRFAGRRVEPALLLAIARQESRFTYSARSSAGARGLMQVMPGTAKVTARRAKLPYDGTRLSADPSYNLSLADAHLAAVLEEFGGSYVLSIAAYNAGGGNVKKWIQRFGDPRTEAIDPLTWIESIPFKETRNYVQRVLEGVQIYRIRLGGAQDLQLNQDLRRPG